MAAVLPDGGILLCGYQYNNDVVARKCSKLLYGTWTSVANLNTPRGLAGMSLTPHGMLVSGGAYDNSGSTEYFNEATDKWSVGPKLPTDTRYHCQITTADMKTWIIGMFTCISFRMSKPIIYHRWQ